jgi:hypothetical protein
MSGRMQVAVVMLVAAGLLLMGLAFNRAIASDHGEPRFGQAAKKHKAKRAGKQVTTRQILGCLHQKGSKRRARCLRLLSRPRPKRVDVHDCLRSSLRVQCLQRLLIRPPKPEAIVNTYPVLPASVKQVQFPDFTADGSKIVAAAQSTDFSGTQIVSFNRDGSGFQCLTCAAWSGAALLKPYTFDDGKRILVRIGQQSPISPADHGVVECSPSVSNCSSATVVPIDPPAATDTNLVQDQRELRIAPDGVHVALSQIRRTASGQQTGVGIVGRLVRGAGSYTIEDARVVASGGELKGFGPDGRSIYFARFGNAYDAGNPDDVAINLRTGAEQRATFAPDWDEDIDRSPGQFKHRGWFVVGSARGTGRLETLGQIRRPLAIEFGTSALNFSIANEPSVAEPWLVDEYEARGRYIGQPLAPGALAAGWDSRPTFRWSPRGNEIVFWQKTLDGSGFRVVISHLRKRKALKLHAPSRSPDPTWARPLSGFVPPDVPIPQSRAGRISGQLAVSVGASPDPSYAYRIVVRYLNFSDIRGFVLNGTETSDFDAPAALYGGQALYNADVSVSGRHTGFLRANGVGLDTFTVEGVIESMLDGRHLTLGPLSG